MFMLINFSKMKRSRLLKYISALFLFYALLKLFSTNGYDGLPLEFKKNVNKTSIVQFVLTPWNYKEENNYFTTFIVKSAVKNAHKRASIRKTWGSVASIQEKKFGVIFLVGKSSTSKEQELLVEENEVFGDILQSNVSDEYKSLPKKVLSGFKFLSEQDDLRTTFVASTDDDCFVDIPHFHDYFSTDQPSKLNRIHCGFVYNDKETPIRDPRSKWHVPKSMYSKDNFPPLCHGGLVVMSLRHVELLYETSLRTEFGDFPLEDVLIFGVLRQKTEDRLGDGSFRVARVKTRGKLAGGKLVRHLHFSDDISNDMRERWLASVSSLDSSKMSFKTRPRLLAKLKYL